MQDGHRGAPTNIFQVVSRAVNAAQKHQLEIWERHADLVLRPDVQSLAWTTFTALKKLSPRAPLPRSAHCLVSKSCWGSRKMPLNISRPGSKLKTKVISGSRRRIDDSHRHLASGFYRSNPSLA